MRKINKGFTLIELMIVISIIMIMGSLIFKIRAGVIIENNKPKVEITIKNHQTSQPKNSDNGGQMDKL